MYFKLLTNDFLFQDGISGWLCEEMSRDGLEMDQMDMSGNTPLHLAARSGNTKTASTLLNLGASVNMKVAFHDQEISLKLFWSLADVDIFIIMFNVDWSSAALDFSSLTSLMPALPSRFLQVLPE